MFESGAIVTYDGRSQRLDVPDGVSFLAALAAVLPPRLVRVLGDGTAIVSNDRRLYCQNGSTASGPYDMVSIDSDRVTATVTIERRNKKKAG